MKIFRKELKIISILVNIVFLCSASAYSYPVNSKKSLRVPVGNNERMVEAIQTYKMLPVKYIGGVEKNTQILFNNALDDEAFGGELLDKLGIEKQDVSSIEILNPQMEGADKQCYKLIITDREDVQYEIALRTIGIDREPFKLQELPIVESTVTNNEQILGFPIGKKHIPLHYGHIRYSIDEIPAIATPAWYRYKPVREDEAYISPEVGYWVLADEWVEGPTLKKLQGQLSPQEFVSMIQQVIIVFCNGLNESVLWAAVETDLDDIALSEKHDGRLMFLDVGFTGESILIYGKKAEIHETLLRLYKSYVNRFQYCNPGQFFEAVEKSKLKIRMAEIFSLMHRDDNLLETSMILARDAIEFAERLRLLINRRRATLAGL